MRQERTHSWHDGKDVMPPVSEKQKRFMQAVAHSPSFAKKVGVPMSVGKEFAMAKVKKFNKGGMSDEDILAMADQIRNRQNMLKKSADNLKGIQADVKETDEYIEQRPEGKYSLIRGLGPGLAAGRLEKDSDKGRFASPGYGDLGQFMKKGGQVKESKAMVKKEVGFMKAKGAPKSMIKHEMEEMKGMKRGGKAYAAGGLAAGHKAADGIAKKGKTRGMEVTMKGSTGMKSGGKVKKMNYGGKC